MKIGCPAIRFADKKASIDATICVGCGLCEQMCKFGAFEEGSSLPTNGAQSEALRPCSCDTNKAHGAAETEGGAAK